MTYDHWKTTEPDPFVHDEPPQQWFTCDACDGEGELPTNWGYEDARPCSKCGGDGGWLDDMEHDQ